MRYNKKKIHELYDTVLELQTVFGLLIGFLMAFFLFSVPGFRFIVYIQRVKRLNAEIFYAETPIEFPGVTIYVRRNGFESFAKNRGVSVF